MKQVQILFFGTPLLAASLLENLLLNHFKIIGVVTQADKIKGNKKEVSVSPTKQVALAHHLPVYTPLKLKKDYENLLNIPYDLIVCVSYGQIIPEVLLKKAVSGALNFHGSLLPKLRGSAPFQRAIEQGDKEVGFTLMEMVQEMDAGKMYQKIAIPLLQNETSTELFTRISPILNDFAIKSLTQYLDHQLIGEKQDESLVTFAPPLRSEEEHISLDLNCHDFICKIRAFSDQPGCYLFLNKKKLKLFKCEFYSDELHPIGQILDPIKAGIRLALKDGVILIKEVQLEGKTRIPSYQFYNGHKDIVGQVLE